MPFVTNLDGMSAREALWQILDDLDSLGDEVKGDDGRYRRAVGPILDRRHDIALTTEGDELTWLRD